MIECGGDADTTAAIVGGIVGAGVGRDGIDTQLIDGICDWPRSVSWMETLGSRLGATIEDNAPGSAPSVNPFAVVLRNLLFLVIVLIHGFRRLAPPY